ncbi:uncharacterized protein PHACADRAFT_23724 [Phanerochaete carnosa HHB-10118-sp]|uniref:Uncharacterized protein n=1 Tax=Phanerochaete carnosa (strain HHB-10118-sp) TaxID=650164 RepID=K5W8W0_PHACS|nr:uncharacterized protein PHACADRAFT_23724 [Phanerochaete carnosa HHB-10118-sp]EKM60353.1 hypothetical protein PHACADRAFT_23724 [Phanerochaete carnosa HHB-10118-sp]
MSLPPGKHADLILELTIREMVAIAEAAGLRMFLYVWHQKARLLEAIIWKGRGQELLDAMQAKRTRELSTATSGAQAGRLLNRQDNAATSAARQVGYNPSVFMDIPSQSELKKKYEQFYLAMSNTGLAHATCAVCRQLRLKSDVPVVEKKLSEIPNHERLRSHEDHTTQDVVSGLVLEQTGCTGSSQDPTVTVCKSCMVELSCQSTQGEHPPKGFSPDSLQSTLVGNVTTFDLNLNCVADMIEGCLMPQHPQVLLQVVSITYVDVKGLSKRWQQATFRVCRHHVGEALRWLKENNPRYYGDVDIQRAQLDQLPEDDEPRGSVLAMERARYVPEGDDDGNPDTSASFGTTSNENSEVGADVIPMYAHGIVDSELSEISSHDLLLTDLVNLWRDGQEGGYLICHGQRPASNFPPSTDSPLAGHNFWKKAFLTLFLYGVGGPECERPVHVSLQEHVQWLLEQHDKRYRLHSNFDFVACSIEQHRQALLSTKLQMRRRDFERDTQIISSVTIADLQEASRQKDRHEPISNAAVKLLKRQVHATASRVLGSDAAHFRFRSEIWSTGIRFGPLSVWLTINPDDIDDVIAHVFVGKNINMDNFMNTVGPDKAARARNIANDTYTAATYFHFIVWTVFETLFGITVHD